MMNSPSTFMTLGSARRQTFRRLTTWLLMAGLSALLGCAAGQPKKQSQDFFTSGSREADQRASQRMAKAEQLAGSGEGAGEKDVKKAEATLDGPRPAQAEGKMALYERLGGERGLAAIVEDFTPRVLQDPRVDWQRGDVKRGGLFHRRQEVAWKATPENVAGLKKHMVQFLALATGGPAHYEGKQMNSVHADMHITNPEFDAALGDLKASLDRLQIPNKEQKELLAIIESTRPQIVTER
jgi:hemoglobin